LSFAEFEADDGQQWLAQSVEDTSPGSSLFMGQHGGQAKPADELKNLYIGVLK